MIANFFNVVYSARQVLENTSVSGMSHRNIVAFFTSIGITPLGAMGRIQHPQGKLDRLLTEVFNIVPACLKTGLTSVRSNSK